MLNLSSLYFKAIVRIVSKHFKYFEPNPNSNHNYLSIPYLNQARAPT